jgi:hypothetical protein
VSGVERVIEASKRLALAAVIAAGLTGCGGAGGGGGSVSAQPLAGMINGQPWTFVAGQTDAFLSSTGDKYFADLYDAPITTPCSIADPAGSIGHLILNIPKTAGHYPLSLSLNQTFSYQDAKGTYQNDIATSGTLDVTSISATEIVGGVNMAYGTNDSVDGQFTISVCAQ